MTLHYKKPVFAILLLILIGIAGYFAWFYFRPTPKITLPSNLMRLDPAVQELVRSKLAVAAEQPRNASVHGDLGLVYEANLLWQEARACFETACELDPDDMLWKLHLAIACRETGDYEEALKRLRNLVKQDPNVSYLQQRLGHALLENGDLNGAESAFRKLIDLASNAPQGYAALGDVLLQKQDYHQAAQLLEKAVALEPNYRTSHYLLGSAYQRLGLPEKAEAELTQGTNAFIQFLPDPTSATVRQYAVNLTARLQQAQEELRGDNAKQAAQMLEETLVHHPENVSLLNNLAVAYMNMGELQKAEGLLGKAQQQHDGQFMTAINFSSLMLRANRAQQALDYADYAIALAPKMDQAYFSRGLALGRLGRTPEALLNIEEALRRSPQNPKNHAFAGDLYMKLGDHSKAQQAYQSALKLDPKMLPALVGNGRANMALGRYSEAESALAQARLIAPDHPLVRQFEQQLRRKVQ